MKGKMKKAGYGKDYRKKPLWQLIVIYVIIGAIVYGVVYLFAFADKGGGSYSSGSMEQKNKQQNDTSGY